MSAPSSPRSGSRRAPGLCAASWRDSPSRNATARWRPYLGARPRARKGYKGDITRGGKVAYTHASFNGRAVAPQRVTGGGTTCGPSGSQGRIGPTSDRSATPARARQLTP
jgi:hypothetical protein